MKSWGIFCTEEEVNKTKEIIEDENLTIFECRKLSGFEKVMYLDISFASVDMCIVMFYATDEQYELVVNRNQLTKVF